MERSDGVELTPRGKRAKALIAMLALAPNMTRSRAWLQDHLWSTRAPAQGSASLRQELSALKKFLHARGVDLIEGDRETIRLIREAVQVEIGDDGDAQGHEELLEGLDISDPEFEDWLRVERSRWRDNRPKDHMSFSLLPAASQKARLTLGLAVCSTPETEPAANNFVSILTRSLLSFEVLDIVDFQGMAHGGAVSRGPNGIDWTLRASFSSSGDMLVVSLVLSDVSEGLTLWSHSEHLPLAEIYLPDSVAVAAVINRIVFRTLDQLANPRTAAASGKYVSARFALAAIYQLFRLQNADLDTAEDLLYRAYSLEPRSSYLGWLTFISVTRLGERRVKRSVEFDGKVRDLMSRAVDSDPYNPLTLSLTAHAHSFIFGEYEYALALLDRAVKADPMHPIAWDLRGITLGYLGDAKRGYSDVMRARAIGPPPPYEFCVDTSCCILAALCGRYEEAISHGRRVLARQPGYLPALRYSAACHGHLGRTRDAAEVIQRLRVYEPDFNVEMLRDPEYPVAGVFGARMIEKGLESLPALYHDA